MQDGTKEVNRQMEHILHSFVKLLKLLKPYNDLNKKVIALCRR